MKDQWLGVLFLGLIVAESAVSGPNQWTSNIPDGGYGTAVHYLQKDSGIAIASAGHRIFRTTDNGATWTPLSNKLMNTGICIAADPTNPDRLLVVANGEGLLRSDDAGLHFAATKSFAEVGHPERSIAISNDGAAWYGGTFNGEVYRSTDTGASWERRSTGLPQVDGASIDSLVIDPQNAGHVYAVFYPAAAVSSSIYETLNGGGTWTPVTTLDCSNSKCKDIAIDYGDSNRLVVPSVFSLYYSSNGGATWNASTTTGAFILVRFHPHVTGRAYAVTWSGSVFRSTNAGQDWVPLGRVHSNNVFDLTFDGTDSERMMLGTSEGVFESDDGGSTWNRRTNGLQASTPLRLVAGGLGAQGLVLASSLGPAGVMRRDAVTGTWLPLGRESLQAQFVDTMDIRAIGWHANDTQVLYAGGGGAILKSTDGGANWYKPSNAFNGMYVMNLAVHVLDPNLIAALTPSNGVYLSHDGASTWEPRSTGLPAVEFNTVALDPNDTQTLVATTAANFSGSGLFKSTDGGHSWTAANTGMGTAAVAQVLFDPRHPGVLYAATYDGTYKSEDGASTWTKLPGDSGNWALAIDPWFPEILYRLRFDVSGFERSVDAGATWENVTSPGLVSQIVLEPARTSNVIASSDYGFMEYEISPDISLSSSVTALAAAAQQSMQLQAVNHGPYAATGVEVLTVLPAEASGVQVTSDKGTCSIQNDVSRCSIGTLKPGETASLSLALTAPSGGLSSSAVMHERDLEPANNTVTLPVEHRHDLSIATTVTSASVKRGTSFGFVVTVNNAGASPGSGIRVTGDLSTNAELVSIQGAAATCTHDGNAFTCDIAALPSGASTSITVDAKATSSGASVLNAQVTSSGVDPVSVNDAVSAAVSITASGGGGGGAFDWTWMGVVLLLGMSRKGAMHSSR